MWVINALQEDYDLYFGHILEPNMYESKRSIKQLVKESIQRIFESDYDDEEKRKMNRKTKKQNKRDPI